MNSWSSLETEDGKAYVVVRVGVMNQACTWLSVRRELSSPAEYTEQVRLARVCIAQLLRDVAAKLETLP